MERSERPATGRSSERPSSRWRREDNEETSRNGSAIERQAGSANARPQTRIERPVSRRGLQSAARGPSPQVQPRASTPTRNAIARPPSASAYSQRLMTGNSRLATMSGSLTRVNTGLPPNMNIVDRPITQQGIAGVRPGTTRGLPMTRQIQDKRYYEGLVQLKIRELSQEISAISREIDAQNKERSTFLHYDNRAKELAGELTELQGQLADYNIVLDKTASNMEQEGIEHETREMSLENERVSREIERLFEQRRMKEQQLRDMNEKIQSEEKKAARIIEMMDRETREKYDKFEGEKSDLETEIGKMQREIDLLSSEKTQLEEQIALSQVKQEAVKLRVKLSEVEAKKEKLLEEQRNKLSPEEERERLLAKVKQDNMEITAAEKRIAEAEKQINEVEHELEQLESDLEENHSEKHVKYKELRKREEAMEQFMPSFEQNKREELEKLDTLEAKVLERLEELSYAIDNDSSMTPSEEMALLKGGQNALENQPNADQSFEGLTREHTKLQQTFGKMENLEKRLKSELEEINEKIVKRQNELVVLEDLDGLKARSEMQYEALISERDTLKKKAPGVGKELLNAKKEHDEIKKHLDKNETYLQINSLEKKLEKLKENNSSIEQFIIEGRDRVNYQPPKERAIALLSQYNTVLKETA